MQWPTMNSDFEPNDISNAKTSDVRFFCQDVVTSTTPLENVKNGRWFVADGSNHQYFSAIAFMSGAMLGTALKNEVPIGIVTAYQGDTNIANWMSDEYYQGTCSTKYLHYNAMVYPLRATKLSGVVWYQGCNNSAAGGDYKELLLKKAMENTKMLSSDVSAGFDPLFAYVNDAKNAAYLGSGIVFNKYTGSRGKSGSNDSNPEYIAWVREAMDSKGVHYQTAELGKVDQGGGGTIAYILGNYNMNVLDAGVAVLNMHAPMEIVSKADVYEAYLAYKAFLEK